MIKSNTLKINFVHKTKGLFINHDHLSPWVSPSFPISLSLTYSLSLHLTFIHLSLSFISYLSNTLSRSLSFFFSLPYLSHSTSIYLSFSLSLSLSASLSLTLHLFLSLLAVFLLTLFYSIVPYAPKCNFNEKIYLNFKPDKIWQRCK